MTKNPKVSIVIPFCSAGVFLSRAVHRLSQISFEYIEFIFVDDGSVQSDERGLINNANRESRNDFLYVRQEINSGVHVARLAGLRQARGKWIGFMDIDDIPHKDMYQILYLRGEEENSDIVICGYQKVTSDGAVISNHTFQDECISSDDIYQMYCERKFGVGALWNKLFRAEVLNPFLAVEMPWRQDFNEDSILNLGPFSRAKSVCTCSQSLYSYVKHAKSATGHQENEDGFVYLFRAYAAALFAYRDVPGVSPEGITELYRRQLCLSGYRVSDIASLTNYKDKLEEAVAIVNRIYPIGLALLCAQRPQIRSGRKQLMISAIRSVLQVGRWKGKDQSKL